MSKIELSNEFVEELFFRQIRDLTIKTNRKTRNFDAVQRQVYDFWL